MAAAQLLLAFRAAMLTAIFAAAALVVEYAQGGDPAFCGVQSACYKVRMSDVGKKIAQGLLDTFGVPVTLPQVALVLLSVVLVISFFVRSKSAVQILAAISTLGALFGLFLVAIQWTLKQFCLFCMVVDLAMLAGAALALLLLARVSATASELAPSTEVTVTGRWVLAATIVGVLPFVWSRFPVVPPLPPAIEKMQVEGKLTVVTLTDFQCPYCRKLHATFAELKKRPDVVLKRVMVPLDGHAGALPAALAYLCASVERKEELADKLYAASPDELVVPNLIAMARDMGMDGRSMEECMALGSTMVRLEDDKAVFQSVAARGLPTTFVGSYPILGYAPDKLLAVAERRDNTPQLPVWTMFVLAAVVLVWVAGTTRRLTANQVSRPTPPTPVSSESGIVE